MRRRGSGASGRPGRSGGAPAVVALFVVLAVPAVGQVNGPSASRAPVVRLAILAAEDRRAPTAGDVATIRAGLNSRDAQTARIAVRACGRLERPDLLADILPLLGHPLPEVRAEAANAVGQAAQGWLRGRSSGKPPRATLDVAASALIATLNDEADPNVRAALSETLGRLPFTSADQVEKAKQALLDLLARSQSAADRLGVAQGFEAIVRLHGKLSSPMSDVLDALRLLAIGTDPARDARVRRVAMEALITAESIDDSVVRRAARDPDSQVRRLAMRALSNSRVGSSDVAEDALKAGLADQSPMVRLEALRTRRLRAGFEDGQRGSRGLRGDACDAPVGAVRDTDPHVMLAALDQLADCSASEAAVLLLQRTVGDVARAAFPRGWHRSAHALVALASAAPERAADALGQFAGSSLWQLRMYGARAAAILKDRPALDKLARDDEDNVREAAIQGLRVVAGHDADAIYVAALERGGYQVLRSAAAALAGTQASEAVPSLKAALHRLVVEGHDNSHDARLAIAETLRGLGTAADVGPTTRVTTATTQLDAADLPRLTSARARVAVRGVGSFELALLASEAPLSAFRFARLVESGYYNGLTFHRVAPNFVVQGGSPGANEYVGDATFMRDEVGQWPHVRGAVGISTRGRDTGDAQVFIDLVDNPRLDHDYTVFAHVLNGMDVVDAILEGDIIDNIELVVGR